MKRVITCIVGVAAIAVGLAAPGASVASDPATTIQFQSQAKLQPDGSALVTITYSCLPGFENPNGVLTLDVEQIQAGGGSGTNVVCDDMKHTVMLDAAPGPYVRGTASGLAQLIEPNSNVTTVEAELQIS